jgi:capsular polysaccharide biosynthesis protein
VEIADYLRIARRRLWILILVPVLAAGVVAAYVVYKGPSYAATATVAAPAVVGGAQTNSSYGGYGGSNGIKAFVGNFTAAATAPQIVNKVSAQTGVPAADVVSGLTVSPIGSSGLMSVTYQAKHERNAGPVARAVASETTRFLFASQLAFAEQASVQAQKELTAAQAALAAFYKSTGLASPDDTYRIRTQEISSLEQAQVQAQASGLTSTAASIAISITAKQQALIPLAQQVTTFHQLNNNVTQANTRVAPLQQAVEQATAQYEAVDPRSVVAVGSTSKNSLLPAMAKKALPAFGAGLFLAVAIVFLLEVMGRSRRREQPGRGFAPVPERALAGNQPVPAPAPALSEHAGTVPGSQRHDPFGSYAPQS